MLEFLVSLIFLIFGYQMYYSQDSFSVSQALICCLQCIWGPESRQNAELLHGEFLRLRLIMIMSLTKDQASLFPTSQQRLSTFGSFCLDGPGFSVMSLRKHIISRLQNSYVVTIIKEYHCQREITWSCWSIWNNSVVFDKFEHNWTLFHSSFSFHSGIAFLTIRCTNCLPLWILYICNILCSDARVASFLFYFFFYRKDISAPEEFFMHTLYQFSPLRLTIILTFVTDNLLGFEVYTSRCPSSYFLCTTSFT